LAKAPSSRVPARLAPPALPHVTRAWALRPPSPLTLPPPAERYAQVRVTFRAARAATLAATRPPRAAASPPPPPAAPPPAGPSSDRVLGFLVGLLTRHATPLGVSGVGIPLRA